MSESKRFLENLKTVILVVLFVTTILLLYLLWSGGNRANLDISELLPFIGGKESTLQCSDVLVGSSVAWGEGDGSFQYRTSNMPGHQQYFIDQFKALYDGTVLSYSVTEDEFFQALRQSKSSILMWDVNIPFEEFCQFNGITAAGGEGIAYISSLSISAAASDSVIVHDGINNLYYRLACEGASISPYPGYYPAEGVSQYYEYNTIYYPADIVLGSSSGALLPIMESSSLKPCRYESEAAEDSEELGISMAEAVFGDTFDFVRRITDDFGTVTYMYGYGQKTLTANNDGSFEYKAETSGESAGYFGDLKTALDFVSSCGGWDSDGVEEISYRLVDASWTGNGRAIEYTFSFAPFIRDHQVHSEGKYPIIVGVSSGEVSYYYRNAFSLKAFAEGDGGPVSDAANVIASNASHMYKVMNDDALSPNTDEAFAYVANAVVSMRKGYYRYDSDNSIVPCWTIQMDDGTRFFFDLYEGVPLGFAR